MAIMSRLAEAFLRKAHTPRFLQQLHAAATLSSGDLAAFPCLSISSNLSLPQQLDQGGGIWCKEKGGEEACSQSAPSFEQIANPCLQHSRKKWAGTWRRGFSSAGARSLCADHERLSQSSSEQQPVSWRDFEDIGVWTVHEEGSSNEERIRNEPAVSQTHLPSDGSSASSSAEMGASRRPRFEAANGGSLKNSRFGVKSPTSSSSSEHRSGSTDNKLKRLATTWKDLKDVSSTSGDEEEGAAAEGEQAPRSNVPLGLVKKWESVKLRRKARQLRKTLEKAGIPRLPTFKGQPFTEEEKKFSFFELCQLPSLRGVQDVQDFLELSEQDLLAQCTIKSVSKTIVEEPTPKKGKKTRKKKKGVKSSGPVTLTHLPTGLVGVGANSGTEENDHKMALQNLQTQIAVRVRRPIPPGPFVPPMRVLTMIPMVDLHPEWALAKRGRPVKPKSMEFVRGCQVLLDLVVSCDLDWAKAAEKMRITDIRFRMLLNQNVHVEQYVKMLKDFKNQLTYLDMTEGPTSHKIQRIIDEAKSSIKSRGKKATVPEDNRNGNDLHKSR